MLEFRRRDNDPHWLRPSSGGRKEGGEGEKPRAMARRRHASLSLSGRRGGAHGPGGGNLDRTATTGWAGTYRRRTYATPATASSWLRCAAGAGRSLSGSPPAGRAVPVDGRLTRMIPRRARPDPCRNPPTMISSSCHRTHSAAAAGRGPPPALVVVDVQCGSAGGVIPGR